MAKTMTFNINAVVADAIARRLAYYIAQTPPTPEIAKEWKSDHASILKLIKDGLSYPNLRDDAIQLLLDIYPTFEKWGYWAECISIFHVALYEKLPADQQVYLHAHLGAIYFLNRNFDDSLNHLNKGLAIAEEYEVKHLLGLLHHRLMNTYIGRMEYGTAKEHGLRALTYLSGTHSKTLAAAYDSLGRIANILKNFTTAENYFWEALSLWDSLKDYTHMARSYSNLGYVFRSQKNLKYAKQCFDSSLEALKNAPNDLDEIRANNGLGIVSYSAKDYRDAADYFLKATVQLEDLLGNNVGWYDLHGSLLHNVGNSRLALGEIQPALLYLTRAKTVWLQADNDLEMGNTVGTIAEAHQADEDWKTAVATYDEAIALLAKFPNHPWAEKLTKNFMQERKVCAEQLQNLSGGA